MSRKIKKRIKVRNTIALLVEGKTEKWYFDMLKRNERQLSFTIKPELPQKKKLKDQFEKVVELSNHYDKVFWVVDFDVILKDNRESKSKVKPIDEYLKYKNKLEKNHSNVICIINNPCIEYWFLLHYMFTDRSFSSCEGSTVLLKKYLPAYDKSEKYFTKENNDIYLKLKPYLNTAIENAQKLNNTIDSTPCRGICQMDRFFAEIGI